MGAGKIFCILGGIITLLATYLFSFGNFPLIPDTYYFGIGLFLNLSLIFQSGQALYIILAVIFLIFLFSGLFILLGIKSRVVAIIGSIFAIGVGIYIILSLYMILPIEIGQGVTEFGQNSLVPGIIPFDVALGGGFLGNVSLGTYLLLGGGVLGLIGGIMGPDGF